MLVGKGVQMLVLPRPTAPVVFIAKV